MPLTGILLAILHGIALLKPTQAQAWLQTFPRSKSWGAALIAITTLWALWLVTNIDLGEFSDWRLRLQVFIPVAGFLTWRYVDEFLAVRALGMLTLLAAEPLLEAAWMRTEASSRLVLVALVYVYIVAAMFWIGTPYVLRDQIAWVSKSACRWRGAALAGLVFGVLLISLGLTLHRSS
jgi:hypothetical protein